MANETVGQETENPYAALLNADVADDEQGVQFQSALSNVLTENASLRETVATQGEQIRQVALNELGRVLANLGQDTLKPDLVLQNLGTGAINEENVAGVLDSLGIKYVQPGTQIEEAPNPQTGSGYFTPMEGPAPVVPPAYARVAPDPQPAVRQVEPQPLQHTTQLQQQITGMVHQEPSHDLTTRVNQAQTWEELQVVLAEEGLMSAPVDLF